MSMTASARLTRGGLRSEIDVNGRHAIVTDEPERLGGTDDGPAPHELLAAAVAGCVATTLAMYARTKNWDMGDITVDVDYDSDATPRRLTIDVQLPEGLSEIQRIRLERVARTCPIRRAFEAGFESDEQLHIGPRLPDVESLLIRPIRPDDKAAMVEGFEHLSDESRYRRFLAPHGRLTAAELRYFTEVDHHDHEAMVAIVPETHDGVGVARYIRSDTEPTVAEIAVAVIDEWQGRGVGTRLISELADRARAEGITSFSAFVLADNEMMLGLLHELGRVQVVHTERGTAELVVELSESGLDRIKRLLGAVARGEITLSGKLGRTRGQKQTKHRKRTAA
jgi:putative redox protein